MPQISTTIQNLLNGVSQQADSQKFPSQAQEQVNGTSSPVLGLTKRNPTEHIAKLFFTTPTDVWAQVLNRDSTEKYMVVVRNSEWQSIRVNITINGSASYDWGSTDTLDLSVGDEVRLKTTGTLPAGFSVDTRYYVVFHSQGVGNDIRLSATKGGSPIALTNEGSGMTDHSICRDPIAVYDLVNDAEKSITTTNGVDYLISTTPSTDMKATSVADYSFMINTTKTVAMDSTLTAAQSYRAYVYIKQGDYHTDYTIEVEGTSYTWQTSFGYDHTDREWVDTEFIAEQIVSGSSDQGEGDGFSEPGFDTPTTKGSTIEFKKTDGTDFEITTHDGLGDAGMDYVKDEADIFTRLPTTCRHEHKVKILGDVESNSDDYYVVFTADSPTNEPFGKGTWAETVAPAIEYKIDASTFCHTLIRESDGNFTFKQGAWGERLAGDDTTNPPPSFIGKKLSNIVLFRDRLGFLSGENICMSEAGEYFNFFRTTVTQTLGTDPVDIRASHNKVSNLKSAQPFSRNLILFSDRTQFQLTGGDVLTPSTVSISQETEFEVDTTADSTVSGTSIYFPFIRGDFSGIMEYFVSPDTEQMNGQDISAHIPKYIEGNVTKMASSASDPLVVLTSSGLPNGFYVYRYMYRGRDRIQSSWSKFTIDSGATIKNIDFIEKTLYMTVLRSDGLYLESMSFKEGDKDANSDYKTALDRRVKETDCTISYDSNTQLTTIVLPYTSYGTVDISTRADGSSEESGTRFPVTQSGNTDTITVSGDLTSRKLWIGDQFSFTYTLNKPYLKVQSEGGTRGNAGSGRFQVRHGNLTYDNSVSFKVVVTPEGRSARTYKFDSRSLNTSGFTLGGPQTLKDGVFKVPIKSKGDIVDIKIINDTPFPSCILTMEYEATYHSRFKQL